MEKQEISLRLSLSEKKKLRSLLTKKGRSKEKLFIAEGIRLLEESLKFKYRPKKIYYSQSIIDSRAKQLIGRFRKLSIPVVVVSEKEVSRISDTKASQGVLGLFDIPTCTNNESFYDDYCRILLLDNIADPGNAGTLIRSALAFGFDLIVVSTNSVEPYNPKVVRSTVGAIFGIKVITTVPVEIINMKKKKKRLLITADMDGVGLKTGLKNIRPDTDFIFAVGSEGEGLSAEIKKMADLKLKIGHKKCVESLNAAVAGSIIMRELYIKTIRKAKL
jgi:TrmH family RNA methyltransferase